MSDHYTVLGLRRADNPDGAAIKRAYHKMALAHHPDRGAPEKRVTNTEIMKMVNIANDTLRDPGKKRALDEALETADRREEAIKRATEQAANQRRRQREEERKREQRREAENEQKARQMGQTSEQAANRWSGRYQGEARQRERGEAQETQETRRRLDAFVSRRRGVAAKMVAKEEGGHGWTSFQDFGCLHVPEPFIERDRRYDSLPPLARRKSTQYRYHVFFERG
jgi:curved DNA-binding protein CbpA